MFYVRVLNSLIPLKVPILKRKVLPVTFIFSSIPKGYRDNTNGDNFKGFESLTRVINHLLTKLAQDRIGRISALGLFVRALLRPI